MKNSIISRKKFKHILLFQIDIAPKKHYFDRNDERNSLQKTKMLRLKSKFSKKCNWITTEQHKIDRITERKSTAHRVDAEYSTPTLIYPAAYINFRLHALLLCFSTSPLLQNYRN